MGGEPSLEWPDMCAWIDPKESGEGWGKRDASDPIPAEVEPTRERAAAVDLPYQFKEHRGYQGTLSGITVEGETYTSGDLKVNAGVTGDRKLKLHVRGVIWNEDPDSTASALRFKVQVVRSPPVTDTVRYGTYEVWERHQFGDVSVDEVTGPSFTPEAGTSGTSREAKDFEDLMEPTKLLVSELELVRNTPFAAYRLEENGDWEEYGAVFRWKGNAFQHRLQ